MGALVTALSFTTVLSNYYQYISSSLGHQKRIRFIVSFIISKLYITIYQVSSLHSFESDVKFGINRVSITGSLCISVVLGLTALIG